MGCAHLLVSRGPRSVSRLRSPFGFAGAAVCVDPFRAQTSLGGRVRIYSADAEAASGTARGTGPHSPRPSQPDGSLRLERRKGLNLTLILILSLTLILSESES